MREVPPQGEQNFQDHHLEEKENTGISGEQEAREALEEEFLGQKALKSHNDLVLSNNDVCLINAKLMGAAFLFYMQSKQTK